MHVGSIATPYFFGRGYSPLGATAWRLERTVNKTHDRPAMPFGNRKNILDLVSSVMSQLKKYHPLET